MLARRSAPLWLALAAIACASSPSPAPSQPADVVFFGESVPKERVQEAYDRLAVADAVLVVGSSLMVFSGFRFVKAAAKEPKPRVDAPVAGGNVETSQRIVDVLLGAMAKACPDRVPAASQGTMNNVTIGGYDPRQNAPFAYYETIAGGMGARPGSDGPSAVHSHMTNTLNTPVEALEYAYPLRVQRYEIRRGSGGVGKYRGGDGICRDVQVMVDSQVTLLSERRRNGPYGLEGGCSGRSGENVLIRGAEEFPLPGKGTFDFQAGDVLSIRTPGGGGFGEESP